MFKDIFKSDFQKWFESQPKHTQEWMKRQPHWHDADLFKFMFYGFILGFMIGVIVAV